MDYEVKKLTKDLIDLKEWEFEAQQRGEQPILLCDFFSRSLNQYFVKYITGEQKDFGYLFSDSNRLNRNIKASDLYFGELKERVRNKKFLKEVIQNAFDLPKEFNRQADDAMSKLKNNLEIGNGDLADYWRDLDEGFLKVIPWFWYPWFLAKEDILTNKVKDGLEKYKTEIDKLTDFQEALLSMVFPVKKTNFQLEQEDMYELLLLEEGTPEFEKKAKEYLKKYDYLTTFILTPILPMTRKQLMERVERARKENYKETFLKQKEDNSKKEIGAQKIIEIIKEDEELIDNIADARELAWALTAGIEEAYMSTSKYLTLLQLVAERIGVKFEETKYFLSKEIFNILKGATKIDNLDLEERKKGFAMMMLDGEQYISYGAEGRALSEWIDKELNKIDNTIKEFKGQIACKGFAKGKVKIALEPAQAHELQEGEILVCPMTNPDYVPAMKRSAAIITDEGGLLSHAAIMSREFNKPCIIGTKIATKLLKNGDIVEVDAEKGIVRKM